MRIVNFILAVIFLIFAFVQINDPDPIIWIIIYGAMSVVCVMAAFKFYPTTFLIGLGIIYLLYAIYYFPGVQEWLQQDSKMDLFDNLAKMEHSYIEESREFLGLMICVAVLVVQLVQSRRK